MEGRDEGDLPSGGSWKPGDTLLLILDTVAMTVTPARPATTGQHAAPRAVGPPISLPSTAHRRGGAVHFCVGRYYGEFKVRLVSLRRTDEITSSAEPSLLARPILAPPSAKEAASLPSLAPLSGARCHARPRSPPPIPS